MQLISEKKSSFSRHPLDGTMYPPWPVYNCQVFLTNKGLIFHWDQWFGCMSVLIMNMLWQKWVCIVVYIWSVAQTQQAQTQHTEYWCCLPNIMWYFTKMPDSFWLKLNVLCILTTLALVHTAKSIQKKHWLLLFYIKALTTTPCKLFTLSGNVSLINGFGS